MPKITKASVDAHRPKSRADGKLVDGFLWDSELKGFGCKATPAGRKTFFVQYRRGGKANNMQRVTLGAHGAITADQARKAAKEVLGRIAGGADPAQEKREAKATVAPVVAPTFAAVMEVYLKLNKGDHASWDEVRRILTCDALPVWGERPINSIKKEDVAALVDSVQVRSHSVARALYAQLRPLFKWAARTYIERSPMVELSPPAPLKARKRLLSLEEIPVCWRAILGLDWPFTPLYQILLLTGQRREEVAGMRWPELDLDAGLWRLPSLEEYRPKRTKNGEEHIVDLSPQVIAILRALPRRSELVFTTTGATSPSGFSKVKRRLDAAMCLELKPDLWKRFCALDGDSEDEEIANAAAKKLGFADAKKLKASILRPWRTHDLRRTWATHVGEQLKFREAVVERALNHLTGTQSGLVGVYQRGEFREERREAQLAWGNFVTHLVG